MSETRFEAAPALHRSGRWAAAEVAYRECLREDEARAGAALATLRLQRSRHREALELLESLAAAAPDNADLAANLSIALRH